MEAHIDQVPIITSLKKIFPICPASQEVKNNSMVKHSYAVSLVCPKYHFVIPKLWHYSLHIVTKEKEETRH